MAKSSSTHTSARTSAPAHTVEVVSPETAVPTFYVNNTGVETSVWDVKLRLAETVETDRENNITKVRELAYIRMSPQHARVVARILVDQLEHYERRFGKIPSAEQGSKKDDGSPK